MLSERKAVPENGEAETLNEMSTFYRGLYIQPDSEQEIKVFKQFPKSGSQLWRPKVKMSTCEEER